MLVNILAPYRDRSVSWKQLRSRWDVGLHRVNRECKSDGRYITMACYFNLILHYLHAISWSFGSKLFNTLILFVLDPRLWPWPLRYEPGSYTWHNVLPRRTFVLNNLKIHPCIVELKPRNTKIVPFLTLTFKLCAWFLIPTHCLA